MGVGIGASAGGIEALRGFFRNLPDPDGLAFVVVLHLSPDRTSMRAEVLRQWTDLPVRQPDRQDWPVCDKPSKLDDLLSRILRPVGRAGS